MRGSILWRLAACCAAPCAAAILPSAAVGSGEPAPPSTVLPTAEIDALFERFRSDAHVPGLVWGIVREGRLVHFGDSGVQALDTRRPVGADSLFRIASMSKAFTALAILKLRDEGRLSLDSEAADHVPELRGWHYPTGDSPPIRIRDLLSHTAGFVTDDPWGDRQQSLPEAEFTRMLKEGVTFTRTPGTAFEYSNFGYALLGRIITNVSGRPYARYIVEEIMRPLGMASTGYEVRDSPIERRAIGYRRENGAWRLEPTMGHGVFGAMGGVETSAQDYARWVAFLLSAWPARDGAEAGPVRRSTVRELAQGLGFPRMSQRPAEEGAPPCRYPIAYGMGMIAGQDCDRGFVLMHSGGYPGYGSFLYLMPERKVGIFAFANRTYAAPVAPVMEAGRLLGQAGQLHVAPEAVSGALAAAYEAAGAMYRDGSVAPAADRLAMNFLRDRSAENWRRHLGELKAALGDCRREVPIRATGRLSGTFSWPCERGRLEGQILLAPTPPSGIQALRLNALTQ